MSSSIPPTAGDMSEANNKAELSGGSSLLCKAREATLYVKEEKKVACPELNPDFLRWDVMVSGY